MNIVWHLKEKVYLKLSYYNDTLILASSSTLLKFGDANYKH